MEKVTAVFCVDCGYKTPYTIKSHKQEMSVRGVNFCYEEKEAFCICCGKEVYVPEISDSNIFAREEAYREAAKIISVKEINDILEKYNIGAGPLAKILGFGEVTISRYLAGQMPSRSHSEKLYEIKNSYEVMEKYLIAGKSEITETAYNKCNEEINKLKEIHGKEKIDIVVQYILSKNIDVTPMAIQKLLYYAQSFFRVLYGRMLFDDCCQAWVKGPVFPNVYQRYKGYGYAPIRDKNLEFESAKCKLSSDEILTIDCVVDAFGKYSGTVLSYFTHEEDPWKEARGHLGPEDPGSDIISTDSINKYFSNVVKEFDIKGPRDIYKYSNHMLRKTI